MPVGTNGNDYLTGTDYGEEFYGRAGNDLMFAYGGNDVFYVDESDGTFSGFDSYFGGDGYDQIVVTGWAPASVNVRAIFSIEVIWGRPNVSDAFATTVKADWLTTTGVVMNLSNTMMYNIKAVFGSPKNDNIWGNGDGTIPISAGAGDDTLNGSNGNDPIDGGDGFDIYNAFGAKGSFVPLAKGGTAYNDGRTWLFRDAAGYLIGLKGVERVVFTDDTMNWDDPPPNSPPAAPADADATANSVAENAAPGTAVGVTAAATDPDGGSPTYSLTDDAGGRFAVNAATGVVTVANGALLDFEAAASHSIVVRATDAGGLFSEATFAVAVTDALEPMAWSGTAGNDTYAAATADLWTLSGLAGDDTLTGGAGNDVLVGGAGADSLNGGAGLDAADYSGSAAGVTINLGLGGTTAQAGAGDGTGDRLANIENLVGSAAADTLTGNASANRLSGGDGSDTLNGAAGADTLEGGAGNDLYTVDNAADVVTEAAGAGDDRVFANVSWTLGAEVERLTLGNGAGLTGTGNGLANTMDGGTGDNLLQGLAGSDTMGGGGGADTLDGGAGVDTLTGGAGADVFRFSAAADSTAAARDAVTDFVAGTDKLDLGLIDADLATAGDQGFAFMGTAAFASGGTASVRYFALSGNTVVEADVGGDGTADLSFRVNGTVALAASDFSAL